MADTVPDNLSSPDDLADLVKSWERDPVGRLDLRHLDRPGHEQRRVDLVTVALLTNLLLGRFADLPVEVLWPSTSSIRRQLRRGGLLFALAQRPGRVDYPDGQPLDEVEAWRGQWRPALGDQLFPDLSPEGFEERLYLYANTHFLGEGFFRSYDEGAAMPWMGDLIPTPENRLRLVARNAFVKSAVGAIVEVLENHPAHAFKVRGDLEPNWIEPYEHRSRSFVVCAVTRGGTGSADRLLVVAADNGYGIGRTLRWQHPGLPTSTGDLLSTVLRRQFRERQIVGHNGRGLWFLSGLARIGGGRVTLITEDDQVQGGPGVQFSFSSPAAEVGETEWQLAATLPVPVRGTVLVASFLIPRGVEGSNEDLVERYRELLEPAGV